MSDEQDIFDLEQLPVSDSRDELAAEPDADTSAKRAGGKGQSVAATRDKLVKAGIGAVIVIAVSWILFPEWFEWESSSASPEMASLRPQIAIQEDATRADPLNESLWGEARASSVDPHVHEDEESGVELSAPGVNKIEEGPEPTAPFEPTKTAGDDVMLANATYDDSELVKAINALNANQLELARRLGELDMRLTAIAGLVAKEPAPRSERKAPEVKAKANSYRDYRSGLDSKGGKLDGYELHTVYRGVAWIKVGDVLQVARPGDRVGNVTVHSIDVPNRVVKTTGGDIR